MDHSHINNAQKELTGYCKKITRINLNPFVILDLPTTATPEDIKQRYRKLFVHPDKCSDSRASLDFKIHRGYDQLRTADTKNNLVD